MERMILLPIGSTHAEAILKGTKKWEYRRRWPKGYEGVRVIIYASGALKQIVGEFVIGRILTKPIDELIRLTIHEACTPDEAPETEISIREYFAADPPCTIGSALRVTRRVRYKPPITRTQIRSVIPGFKAPQRFMRLTEGEPALRPLIQMVNRARRRARS